MDEILQDRARAREVKTLDGDDTPIFVTCSGGGRRIRRRSLVLLLWKGYSVGIACVLFFVFFRCKCRWYNLSRINYLLHLTNHPVQPSLLRNAIVSIHFRPLPSRASGAVNTFASLFPSIPPTQTVNGAMPVPLHPL
ncbi:hypothetical protein BDP27DRAFT_1071625 [Rhodocollybia butyracea]|uniref:Uncharacterized protein n=1 Tax=Rhodocollybia butyracea TaxID=206335 RepID=A0A9P5PPM5_9AGAR|nr:hypothetical protein BDP27DRAFT_1071625 [Rhodocollybia butyracea]